MTKSNKGAIGIFDSGYGGLTILKEIVKAMPEYDYIYLGDNARAPYGTRSFDIVYEFTLQAVKKLFDLGCPLVILACNTASAKALRTIQQKDLPIIDPTNRVLGVIRPTVEAIGEMTKTRHIGVVATAGTVNSRSYELEVEKLFPGIRVNSQACPMWVPLVEYNEYESDGADFFIKKELDTLMSKDKDIDTIILGCTHYPLLKDKIMANIPKDVNVISQGEYVANSLKDYMKRHPEIENRCSKGSKHTFLTTESEEKFEESASTFLGKDIKAKRIILE